MIQTTLILISNAAITEPKKSAQRSIILDMLKIGPCNCSLFMRAGIAQYNARILELRQVGHKIVYDKTAKVFYIDKKDNKHLA